MKSGVVNINISTGLTIELAVYVMFPGVHIYVLDDDVVDDDDDDNDYGWNRVYIQL